MESPAPFHCRAGVAPRPDGTLLSCKDAQPPLLWELLEQAWVPPQTNEVTSECGAQELNCLKIILSLKSSCGDFEEQSCLRTKTIVKLCSSPSTYHLFRSAAFHSFSTIPGPQEEPPSLMITQGEYQGSLNARCCFKSFTYYNSCCLFSSLRWVLPLTPRL